MPDANLAGARLLLLEDEFLIAMDVEQLFLDQGVTTVLICRSLAEAHAVRESFDAAILDVMLSGENTLTFAAGLKDRGIPFIFASGYTAREDIAKNFPGVTVVSKPYSGDDLVGAVAAAMAASDQDG